MPFLDRLLRRTPTETADVEKVNVPRGAQTYTAEQVANSLAEQGMKVVPQAAPMPWFDPAVGFGPGRPLRPASIDPAGPSGRPEPRLSEYPVSYNLPGTDSLALPWKILRETADRVGLMRRAIEVRKSHMASADWGFVISDRAIKRALAQAGDSGNRQDVEQTLRTKLADDIARAEEFWLNPDRGNGLNFGDWVQQLLEEHFVLDACAIYPRRTLGGGVYALEVLDGSTIKPLLNYRGGRPTPPNAAYQQILHGFPRGEFTATVAADYETGEPIPGGMTADQLIYKRRNVRSWTPYGFPAVEQALFDTEVWMRRQQWIKSEYTDGVMPSAWLEMDLSNGSGQSMSSWTPDQVAVYEDALNDLWSGSTAERHRFKILPPGLTPVERTEVTDKYKSDYDLFLLKLVLTHFDVTPAEMGFMESTGLGGASFHEGQSDVQDRKGTRPTELWLARLFTEISHNVLGINPDLEFQWLSEDVEDEKSSDDVAMQRVQSGRGTLNEDRDRQGKPRYTFPEADMPMIVTATGVTFLEGEKDRQEQTQQQAADAAQAALTAPAASEEDEPKPGEPKPPGQKPAAGKGTDDAKKTELAALRKFLSKGERSRPFVVHHLTDEDFIAAGIDGDTVGTHCRFAAKGDDARGREQDVDRLGALRNRPEPLHVPYRPGC